MTDMQANVEITLNDYMNDIIIKRSDFTNPCEARAWLKRITEPLVTLVEEDVLQGFSTQFIVTRKGEE